MQVEMHATSAAVFHSDHFPKIFHPPGPKLFVECGMPKSCNVFNKQLFSKTDKNINLPTLGGKQTALMIYSQLSRCSTARGSRAGVSLVGPAKVEAHKLFLYIEISLNLKLKIFNMLKNNDDDSLDGLYKTCPNTII